MAHEHGPDAGHERCTLVSAASREDPIGSAFPFDRCLFVEVPPPWASDIRRSPHFPRGLESVWLKARRDGRSVWLLGVVPEPHQTRPGHRVLLDVLRPPGPFARFEQTLYLVPDGKVSDLAHALLDAHDGKLRQFERYRQETDSARTLLVCSHGSVDPCCADFGIPLYRLLREQYGHASGGQLSVWEVSHFGGHRFAPTLCDLPEVRWWGHLTPELLDLLIHHRGHPSTLRLHYRGWSGLGSRFEQVLEREALVERGWEWLDYRKAGRLLSVAPDDRWAEVRLDFISPDGTSGAYEARVEVDHTLSVLGRCTGSGLTMPVQQFRVSHLRRLDAGKVLRHGSAVAG